MTAIDKMLQQFKTQPELEAFAKAQQKTIIELTKKNKALETEVKSLKKLTESKIIIPGNEENKIDFSASDEESIARQQLFKLKEISNERELTYEETKRVEIFSKLLIALKDKPKTIEVKSKNLSDAELIALAVKTEDDDRQDDQH